MLLVFKHMRQLSQDNRGAVAIISAIALTALLGIVSLTTDLGYVFLSKRRLQAATDSAAMAAAQNPSQANAIATQVLTDNGFPNAHILSLTTGFYVPNPSWPISQRYTVGSAPVNAVALTTSVVTPLNFARVISSLQSLSPSVNSTAYQQNEAGLSAGSGLASLNGGLINSILGTMLGTNLSLTANSYQGLADTNISALSFIDALAAQLNLTAGTYSQVLASTVSVQSLLQAEVSVLSQQGQLTSDQLNALNGLESLIAEINGSPSISLASLFDLGAWSNAPIASVTAPSALAATLNLFQLNTFAAQLANGQNFVNASNALNIPGIATVSVGLTDIEPPQGTYYAMGPVGLSVHTSQVRLLLTANLLSTLSYGTGSAPVQLKVYTEMASGTATTTGIACGSNPNVDTTVSVSAQSGVANLYVGNVTPNAMTNFTSPVTVSSSPIVNVLGLVTINGTAQVPVQGNTAALTFTEPQIQAGTVQTVSSTNMLSNLGNGLSSNLQLSGNVLGIPVTPAAPTVQALNLLLQPVFQSLDGIIDQVLGTLGVRVGYLDVTVTGVRCGVPTLVR